jgi:hypothetical protein
MKAEKYKIKVPVESISVEDCSLLSFKHYRWSEQALSGLFDKGTNLVHDGYNLLIYLYPKYLVY